MAETTIDAKRAASFSADDSIEITIAPNAGACFGVVRAIKLGHAAIGKSQRRGGTVFSYGQLIHNPKVVSELEANGVKTVTDASLVDSGTVILRSHGVVREIEADFKTRGVAIVDATCPLVKKPQRIAGSLADKGYFLVLVGDANHPEVKGVLSYFGTDRFLVTYNADEVSRIPSEVTKVGVIAQTTIELKVFQAVVDRCRERFDDVAVYNTICDATSIRQDEAEMLARSAEIVIVVGGRNSSNTNKLVKICKDHQKETHLIEEIHEIERDWFAGKRKIGVTGGASTPMEFVDAVGYHIAQLIQNSEMT